MIECLRCSKQRIRCACRNVSLNVGRDIQIEEDQVSARFLIIECGEHGVVGSNRENVVEGSRRAEDGSGTVVGDDDVIGLIKPVGG